MGVKALTRATKRVIKKNLTHIWYTSRQEIINFLYMTYLKNFGNATSREANITEFFRITNNDIRKQSWKFQINKAKIGYFTEQSKCWSVKYKTFIKCEVRHVTSANLMGYVMPFTSINWSSSKSFWYLERKRYFRKGRHDGIFKVLRCK